MIQSICHPFATAIFKNIIIQRSGSEHTEQSADSLPVFLFMTFLLVWFFQVAWKARGASYNKWRYVSRIEKGPKKGCDAEAISESEI